MNTSIDFIPIDYDYFDFNGKSYIKLIGRTSDKKRICVVDSFDPYFWAILKDNTPEKRIKEIQNKISKIKIKSSSRTTSIIKTELHNKKFLGKDVKAIKIFITNYKDGHAVADKLGMKEIIARRGYDIRLLSKYIIDKKITPLTWYKVSGEIIDNEDFGGIANIDVDLCIKADEIKKAEEQIPFTPKVLAFDIEADEFEIGKGHVIMISLVSDNFKKVLTWKHCKIKQDFVECFKDEEDMLEAFIEYIKEQDPDIITGYFSDGFDLPYLRARAVHNKVKLALGLDNSQPKFARGRIPSARTSGIVHIDLFRFIQTAYSQYLQSETLGLNDVASELLGESKIEFEHSRKKKRTEQEWKDFFEYNLQDSLLTYKLFQKAWCDISEFSKVIQEPLFEVTRDTMATNSENYTLHNLDKYNEIPEKKPIHDEISARRARPRYQGAFVLQPEPSLYENLAIFDFTSYWPSIIVTFNLSRATLLSKKQKDSIQVDLGEEKVYFSKEQSFFAKILGEIIEKRKLYKQQYNKNPSPITRARSNAYKLLANASYGYLGFFGARYYCPEAGASATSISRDFIKKTIDIMNKNKYKVIYSDTDSIAFLLNKHSQTQALKLLEQINKNLPGIMELDLEDFYKRGIWVTKRSGEFGAKKKYALINQKGKMKIRGFETVRRDWCRLAREVQNNVLNLILKNGNEKKALEYLKETIKKLKKREIEKKQLIIRTQLKKPISEYKANTPHIAIAKQMQEKEMPIDIGMLIEYYIAESKNKKDRIRDKAKLPEENLPYDIDYYLNNQILPAVENIFQVFDIKIKDIIAGGKQATLF